MKQQMQNFQDSDYFLNNKIIKELPVLDLFFESQILQANTKTPLFSKKRNFPKKLMHEKCGKCNNNQATAFYQSALVCNECYQKLLREDKSKRRFLLAHER